MSFSYQRGVSSVFVGVLLATSAYAIEGPIWISNFGAGNQIWFQAEHWDERDPDDATYFEAIVADGALGGLAVTRHGGAGGRLMYAFDIELGDGVGGPWTMWARTQNPSNASDYMLVEEDPDDADIPAGPAPYPGGDGVFPFTNDDDRILEGDTNGWGWQGNEEGHFKELQDGENIMYIFHRQGNESQLVDLYCWTDDPGYVPTEDDFLNAECVVNCDQCPAEGDTHCTGADVESVAGDDLEGIYRVTIDAVDDSDDPIFDEVVATHSDPGVTPVKINTIGENEVLLFLTGGTWTITTTVDDDPSCDDAAPDGACTLDPIAVVGRDRPEPMTPFWVSSFGGARQIWFRASDWNERLPDTDDFFLTAERDGSLSDEVMIRAGSAGGCVRYDFNISEADGVGGEWYLHARLINPENRSDYMLVEGDPGDLVGFPEFDPDLGYPGGNGAAPFDNGDDRVFEGTRDDWSWFTGGEGHVKTLHEGVNSMYFFHREGRENRPIDVFCWTDSRDYAPTDQDFLDAELRNVDCGTNLPDTHCQGIAVAGPPGNTTGVYTVTVDAVDDSGDEIVYSVSARRDPNEPPVTARSVGTNALEIFLGAGEWEITATVDDDPLCPDEAADNSCAHDPVTVVPREALPGPRVSEFAGGIQIWFEAESFLERVPETDEFFPLVDASADGAFGQAVSRDGGAGGCMLWEFDLAEAGGQRGVWYMWARVHNPGNMSDYMLVEGDPGDFDIPEDEPYPGGDGVAPFDNLTDRVLEGTVRDWGWFGGSQEGHIKELQDGPNLMYLFHREGDPTVFWDVICWTNTDQYVPNDDDYDDSDPIGDVAPRPQFHRGDTDGDGSIIISDAVGMLNFLFGGGTDTTCKETQDFDNDGNVVITDAVAILLFLFSSGAPPAAPGPHTEPCGPDPDPEGSPGDLGCELYAGC